MKKRSDGEHRKSIFQAIFVPLIFVMILQALIFYLSAVYGGVEQSLNKNASDILTERMTNRKNEVETLFNKDWNNLAVCEKYLDELYASYQKEYGNMPFADDTKLQVKYISDAFDILANQLRENHTNGIFLVLNDKTEKTSFSKDGNENKYGCCIRDMDSTSAYTDREDLLLERMPSSLVEQTGCSLDSWWEAVYTFTSEDNGSFYYNPLNAAWDNPDADGEDIAYFEGTHRLSTSDNQVVSYSIPLTDKNGKPYAVLGVELTTKYLSSLLPNKELGDSNKTAYILAQHKVGSDECTPYVANGALYNRCFREGMVIPCSQTAPTGGFILFGQDDTELYGTMAKLNIYNNNNPFEDDELVLIAVEESDSLFYYSQNVKHNLLFVSAISLVLGVVCIFIVSHRFAQPITSLAKEARNVEPQQNFHLQHLGIAEIDQLVDSIEELNKNVSRETARIEFFSRMSHDMRTPMNAIISFSSNEMLDGADEERKNDYLGKIHNSGQYLLGLINEVLDMTKIESRKVDLQYENVSAKGIMDTVISMVVKLADQKNIDFVRDIKTPQNTYIKTDTQHLNQILLNLLSNAVKFTKENGRVTLKCDMTQVDTSKMHCTFVVSDNGIGISEEFMKKLYQPFEQEKEGQGGTGLGLSISKKLTELMGGTISCSSQKGVGTTFTVELDFDVAQNVQNEQTNISAAEEDTDIEVLKGKHILICEDQPLNVLIAQRLLERVGMIVEVANNGQLGTEVFAASELNHFDAVLMDIRMPVLDGLGATKAIRAMDREDARGIPIIAMTANAFEEDMKMSREVGMNEHLSKPIDPKLLYHTLARFLSI